MNRPLVTACALVLAMTGADNVFAQKADDYPSRPVRAIVPYAPGGGTDILGRALAAKLTDFWGRQVIVDNRGGGGTVIGTDMAAKSPPDGYTLLITSTSFVINPTFKQKLPCDTLKDFDPVSQIAFQPYILVVHPKVPARDVKEFIALAKSRPGTLNFGSTGMGSGSQLAGELFKVMTRTDMVHISYKGMSPALTDTLGGQTQFIFGSILTVVQHIKSGRLRALGVTSSRRSSVVPEVPTIAEAGVPGYSATSWAAVYTPAGVPRAILAKLNADVVKAVNAPDMRERLAADGAEPASSTPKELGELVRTEIAKWAKVLKAANIKE